MVLFPIGKKEAFKKFKFLKICIGTQELDVFSVFEYFIDEVYISTVKEILNCVIKYVNV